MEDKKSVTVNFGFLGPIQVILIILKLIGKFSYSWWIVLVPTLIPLAFFGGLISLFLIGVLASSILEDRDARKFRRLPARRHPLSLR